MSGLVLGAETGDSRLAASYTACARAARRAASNFYPAFWLLPKRQRLATCALYAFYRHTDDLADAAGLASRAERVAALDGWRDDLRLSLAGAARGPLLPAVADTAARYDIPREYLFDAIEGVRMDLEGARFETVADLEGYCYRVASVVGLACIYVWGFRGAEAVELARQCGYAFQWTNILRDLSEDARRGRVYLPAESFRGFGYTPEELAAGVIDERLGALLAAEIHRARVYFARGAPLAGLLSPPGRRVFTAMFRTYQELLDRIERAGAASLGNRVRIPRLRKFQIVAGALLLPRATAKGGPAS